MLTWFGLTIEDRAIFMNRLITVSVIPLSPKSVLLQPVRRPDCIAHTQAACQPHTGLSKPEATDGVPPLKQIHISTLLRGRERENKETGENRFNIDVI